MAAALLHAGAETLRDQIGHVPPAPRARELEREYLPIRKAMGAAAFDAAWKHGATLEAEQLTDQARLVLGSRN